MQLQWSLPTCVFVQCAVHKNLQFVLAAATSFLQLGGRRRAAAGVKTSAALDNFPMLVSSNRNYFKSGSFCILRGPLSEPILSYQLMQFANELHWRRRRRRRLLCNGLARAEELA